MSRRSRGSRFTSPGACSSAVSADRGKVSVLPPLQEYAANILEVLAATREDLHRREIFDADARCGQAIDVDRTTASHKFCCRLGCAITTSTGTPVPE
jgi:hypothetical protein